MFYIPLLKEDSSSPNILTFCSAGASDASRPFGFVYLPVANHRTNWLSNDGESLKLLSLLSGELPSTVLEKKSGCLDTALGELECQFIAFIWWEIRQYVFHIPCVSPHVV